MKKSFLLATTTFIEMLRQPGYFFMFFGTGLIIILIPFFTLFAFYETKRLIIEMGLASISVMSIVAVSFTASHTIYAEMKRKTVLLILAMPISRFTFLLGKYLGVIFSGLFLIIFLSILLVIAVRMGAPESAAYTVDQPGVLVSFMIFLIALFYGFFQNYFNRKNFYIQSILAAMGCSVVLFTLLGVFGRTWEITHYWQNFSMELFKGILLITIAMMVLGSISVLLSAYLSREANLIATFSIFVLGLLSDHLLSSQKGNLFYDALYNLIPNFHVFLVSDTIVFERYITPDYMQDAILYGVFLMVAFFLLALVVFERKEIS